MAEQIGTVPCPYKGCDAVAAVYRFTPRSGRGSAFKGKRYGICPKCGKFGGDAKGVMQEYIVGAATIWGASGKPVEPAREPESAGQNSTRQSRVEAAPVPAKAPASETAIKPAAKPVQPKQEPAAEPAQKPKGSEWGPLIQ